MTDRLRVSVAEGKYTIIQPEDGPMFFLRYDAPWSDPGESIRYGNMILAMAYEVDELRTSLEAMRQERDGARVMFTRVKHALDVLQNSLDERLIVQEAEDGTLTVRREKLDPPGTVRAASDEEAERAQQDLFR